MPGGWVDRKNIPRGPNGRGLCRWCSLEVPRSRFTFCSEFCVHEWKLRTQPGYLREQVLARDHGICAACSIDTIAAARALRYTRGARRQELFEHWGLRNRETRKAASQRRSTRKRKTLWDADHILPVAEGGGECDLENLRTLCLRCHRSATDALRARVRKKRAATPHLNGK